MTNTKHVNDYLETCGWAFFPNILKNKTIIQNIKQIPSAAGAPAPGGYFFANYFENCCFCVFFKKHHLEWDASYHSFEGRPAFHPEAFGGFGAGCPHCLWDVGAVGEEFCKELNDFQCNIGDLFTD